MLRKYSDEVEGLVISVGLENQSVMAKFLVGLVRRTSEVRDFFIYYQTQILTTAILECSYDERISKRRPHSAVYVADLERENQRLKSTMNAMLSLKDDSVKMESPMVEQESSVNYDSSCTRSDSQAMIEAGSSEHLETMITTTERLFLDERGKYRYQGHSAGFTLLGDVHERIDQMLRDSPGTEDWTPFDTLKAFDHTSPLTYTLSALERTEILPSKDVAQELSGIALDDGCCLMSFVHRPTFNRLLDQVYANNEGLSSEENEFLPVLYEALALGTLFSVEKMKLQPNKNETERRSLMYFHAGRSLLDMMACRDLFTLQAIMFMVMYLQSSARLSACHSYLSVAIASAMRMGVRSSTASAAFSIVEQETRKRIIWELHTMETYVTAMLGLPKLLNQDYIHQDLPSEGEVYEDTEENAEGYLPNPDVTLVASNSHTKLILILSKIITEVYPVAARGTGARYQVDYKQIIETERLLAEWHTSLPSDFATDPNDPRRTVQIRTQLRLRLAYAHVEMVLYRPFLHHLIRKGTGTAPDLRSYACASACIKAAMQVIWLVEQLDSQDLLTGPYWLTVYMTFFASMSLLLFALGSDRDPTASDSLMAAEKGRQILMALAPSCPMAAGSAESLTDLSKRIARASAIQISESYSFAAEFSNPISPV